MLIDAIKAGLKCDGITDDTPALAAVIQEQARKRSVTIVFPDGADIAIGNLVIGDGTATTTSTYHNVQLMGWGPGSVWGAQRGVDSGNTRFVYPASAPDNGFMIRYQGPIFGGGIAGIRLDGRNRARILWLSTLYEGVFRNLACLNAGGDYAILLDSIGPPGIPATMRCTFRGLYVWTGNSGGIKLGNILTASEVCSNRFDTLEVLAAGTGHAHCVLVELGDSNTFARLNCGPMGGTLVESITVARGVATLFTKTPHLMSSRDGIYVQGDASTPASLRGNFDATPAGGNLVLTFPAPGCPDGKYYAPEIHSSGLQLARTWQTIVDGFVSPTGCSWTEPDPGYLLAHNCGGFMAGENDGNLITGLMDQEQGGISCVKPGRLSIITTHGDTFNLRVAGSAPPVVTPPPVQPIPEPAPIVQPPSVGLVNADLSEGLKGWIATGNWYPAEERQVAGSTPQGAFYQILPVDHPGAQYSLAVSLMSVAGTDKPAAIGFRFMDARDVEIALPMASCPTTQGGTIMVRLQAVAPAGTAKVWVLGCVLDAGLRMGAWRVLGVSLGIT